MRVVVWAVLATLVFVPAAPGESSPIEITGFSATFDQSEFTTTYNVSARGKKLSYKWTKVQSGKECGLFTPDGARATWRHPHKSQMDPAVPQDKWCEDAQQTGGHKGTITVVVSDGTWSCTQTWPFGSLPTQDVKEAGGTVPKPVCIRTTSSSTAATATPAPPDLQVRVVGPKSWSVRVLKKGLGNAISEYRRVADLHYLVKVTNDGPGKVERPFLTVSFFDGQGRPVEWVPRYGLGSLWDCEPGYADETHRITCRYVYAAMAPKETAEFRINIYSDSKEDPGNLDSSPVLKRFTKRGLVVKASVGTSTKERTTTNNRAEQTTTFIAVIV